MKVSRFTFNMFGVNTYILWDDKTLDAIIVDPGMISSDDNRQIDEFISSNKLQLKHLINTHMHIDHSFGVSHILNQYSIPLECNLDDQFLAQRLLQQAQMFGLQISIEDLSISINLCDNDIITIGNEIIQIIQVPGHSPGSIVLYAPESSFIISGDVLFRNSIGRTDLPGGNYHQLIEAIQNKLFVLNGDTCVYPGHGPETTIGYERAHNPYLE